MSPIPVYIATPDADEYARLIRDRLDAPMPFALAATVEQAVENYTGQPILLARPDFAAAILQNRPPVQWVQSTWAGVTPLVNHPFREYLLTGVKDVFGKPMAEYVIGYMLAHELRIAERARRQQDKKWKPGDDCNGLLQGKTLGVMGTGSIGRQVAETAGAFAMEPIGYNTGGEAVTPFAAVYSSDNLSAFLQRSDYVVGVLPDLPATTNLLNADTLADMKKSALLINVGRGNLIDEQALVAALRSGQIAGAVLDVFREEPLPPSSPLWEAPGLIITPHVAAVSGPGDIVGIFLENYRRFSTGEPFLHQVDFEKGY